MGSGKVRLGLTLKDKTIEFKGSEWRLYSHRRSICRSYQRLQCMFLKRYHSRKFLHKIYTKDQCEYKRSPKILPQPQGSMGEKREGEERSQVKSSLIINFAAKVAE